MRYVESQASTRQAMRPTRLCPCGKPSTIWLSQIERGGSRLTVAPSEAMDKDWNLRADTILISWVERCGFCYSLERMAEDVSRWKQQHPEKPYPIPSGKKPPFSLITSRETFCAHFGVTRVADAFCL